MNRQVETSIESKRPKQIPFISLRASKSLACPIHCGNNPYIFINKKPHLTLIKANWLIILLIKKRNCMRIRNFYIKQFFPPYCIKNFQILKGHPSCTSNLQYNHWICLESLWWKSIRSALSSRDLKWLDHFRARTPVSSMKSAGIAAT